MNPSESDQPYPPRFRWLKRLGLIGVIALALLVGLRLWWGHLAQKRLDALVNDIHARGGKILISDYQTAPIADDQNAAVTLRAAFTSMVTSKEESDWLFDEEAGLSDKDKHIIQAMLRDNARTIQLVREARGKPKVDWGVRLTTPAMNVTLGHLNMMRRLATMHHYGVYYEHAQGNDRAALEHASDILFLSGTLEAEPAFLISHLVASSVRMMAAHALVRITPDLRAGDPACAQQARSLITQLLDEQTLRRGMRQSWEGEQAAAIDNIPFFARQQLSRPVAEVFMPMFVLDAVRAARDMDAGAQALDQKDFIAARTVKLPMRSGDNYPMLLCATRLMSGFLATAPTNAILTRQFTNIAESRGTAIALAIHLYAVDHGGKLPERLDQLVPRYLPQLPTDPFTAGAAFRYKPSGSEPVLYSEGTNLRDDGGAKDTRRGPPLDIVFPLYVQKPATQPAGEAESQ